MSLKAPTPPTTPQPPIPAPQLAPANQKPQRKAMQPTYLGAATAPTQAQAPGKTLLGQ